MDLDYFCFPGGLNCIAKKRVYLGRLSYLPVDEDESTIQSPNPGSESNHNISSNQELSEFVDGSEHSDEDRNAIAVDTTTLVEPVSSTPESASNQVTSEMFLDPAAELAYNPATSESLPVPTAGFASAISSESVPPSVPGEAIVSKCLYGPKADLLSPLSSPVPSNWKITEQKLYTIIALSTPHMNSDSFGDRNLSIGCHKFSIVTIDTSISRMNLLLLFKRTEDSTHLDMDGCNVIRAKAFRLEPETPGGLMTVDGELVPYGPIQTQLHPDLARVMCRKRKDKKLN